MRRIDLHCHTDRSDGKHPPADVLAFAARSGLDALAITDHDLASVLEPGVHALEGRQIRLIGAAELSGTHRGTEQHLLVYFPGEIPDAFRAVCRGLVQERAQRYDAAATRIGGDLPRANADAHAGDRSLTRHHLARALVTAGVAESISDAFARFCGDHSAMVPPIRLAFTEAIALARAHGGVPVWAHPSITVLESWIGELARAGLAGIEGIRPNQTGRVQQRYKKAAKKHGLFVTGGSDWHGWPADGALGTFYVTPQDVGAFLAALDGPEARSA